MLSGLVLGRVFGQELCFGENFGFLCCDEKEGPLGALLEYKAKEPDLGLMVWCCWFSSCVS